MAEPTGTAPIDCEAPPPLVHATVVEVAAPTERDESPFDPTQLDIGASVRVKATADSRHAGQIGVLQEKADNFPPLLRLRFADDQTEALYPAHLERAETDHTVIMLAYDGRLVELPAPTRLTLEAGATVQLELKSLTVVGIADVEPAGEIALVRKVGPRTSEVDHHGTVRVVYNGAATELKPGDRVILDAGGLVVRRNLGRDESTFQFDEDTHVDWDDIGGNELPKQELIEGVEWPRVHARLYELFGQKPPKGILLYGPPGCGKTMLAKATATALKRLAGGEATGGFLYVKGAEVLDKYVGVAEAAIRSLFAYCRDFKARHGYPAVLCFDEADALFGRRGAGISSDIERTTVPALLAEMDGMEDSGALVILLTNRPDSLDPAVLRPGRIDRKIRIGRPSMADARAIFALNLAGRPLVPGETVEGLADLASRALFAESYVLYQVQLANGTSVTFSLGQLCNGAMVANLVEQATAIAMRRAVAGGSVGLTAEDLQVAVAQVFAEEQELNHPDALKEFADDQTETVTGVLKLRQGHV